MRLRVFVALVACAALAGACSSGGGSDVSSRTRVDDMDAVTDDTVTTTNRTTVDTTRLPLGDGKYGASAVRGSIFSCQQSFSGGGAFASGSWIRADGTFDLSAKPTVDGDVSWPGSVTITPQGSSRTIASNGVPGAHTTGVFPIASTDDAFQFDRNPNRITTQSINVSIPADPKVAASPTCLGMGPIGVMTSGVIVFNGLDAGGRDAVAHEIQDHCAGHPQMQGVYHYHSATECIPDPGSGHSARLGYALDGFGIYGARGENGSPLTNDDLDECHGHAHTIDWDGTQVSMYHYHLTAEYPYTLGCYRGTPTQIAGIR